MGVQKKCALEDEIIWLRCACYMKAFRGQIFHEDAVWQRTFDYPHIAY